MPLKSLPELVPFRLTKTWVDPVRFSTTAKKVLPRNTDFICGNQKRTANPHKCTFSCGIGRDFHITLKLVGGPQASYEHICLVLPTSVSGTTQLARLEISGGPPRETHGVMKLSYFHGKRRVRERSPPAGRNYAIGVPSLRNTSWRFTAPECNGPLPSRGHTC